MNKPAYASRIKARATEIENEIKRLAQELDELHVAYKVLTRLGDEVREESLVNSRSAPRKSRLTVSEVLIAAMRGSDQIWWTTTQLRDEAKKYRDDEIQTTTISPTLTRMKAEGVIIRDGLSVALSERATKDKAPDAFALEPQ